MATDESDTRTPYAEFSDRYRLRSSSHGPSRDDHVSSQSRSAVNGRLPRCHRVCRITADVMFRMVTSTFQTFLMLMTAGKIRTKRNQDGPCDILDSQDGQLGNFLFMGSLFACVLGVIVSYFVTPDKVSIVFVECLLLGIGILGCIVMSLVAICYKLGKVPRARVSLVDRHPHLSKYETRYLKLTLCCLILFGVVNVLFMSFHFAAWGKCENPSSPLGIGFKMVQLLYIFSDVIFLSVFGLMSLETSIPLQMAFTFIILSNVCVWFASVMNEWQTAGVSSMMRNITDSDIVNRSFLLKVSNCSEADLGLHLFQHTQPFAHPMFVAFVFLAIVMIIDMEARSDTTQIQHQTEGSAHVSHVPNLRGDASQSDEMSPLLNTDCTVNTSPVGDVRDIDHIDCSVGRVVLVILFAVLLSVGLNLYPIFLPSDVLGPYHNELFTAFGVYFIVFLIAMLLSLFSGFSQLRSECCPLNTKYVIRADEGIFLMCNFALMFANVFDMIPGVYLTGDSEFVVRAALEVIKYVLNMLAVWMQTTFVITARKFVSYKGPHVTSSRPKLNVQYTCMFLTVCNLGYWAYDSFIQLHWQFRTNPVQSKYYENEMWSKINHTVTPLAVFYRFYSFLALLKLSFLFSFRFQEVG